GGTGARRGALREARRGAGRGLRSSCRVTPIGPTPFNPAHQAASPPLLNERGSDPRPTAGGCFAATSRSRPTSPTRLAALVAGSLRSRGRLGVLTSAHIAAISPARIRRARERDGGGRLGGAERRSRAPSASRRRSETEPEGTGASGGEDLLNLAFHRGRRHLLRERELLNEQTPRLIEQPPLAER